VSEAEGNKKNHRRKVAAAVVLSAIAVVAAVSVVLYLRYKSTHITTDDAFITGRVHTVAFKVPGTVRAVHVSDNQLVNKGDLLIELDPADYEVRVRKALSDLAEEEAKLSEQEAGIEAAKRRHSELMADVEASKAELGLEEARLGQAEIDIKRYESLFKKEAVSRERYQQMETDYTVAKARVTASAKELARAEMALKAQEAVIKQARAARQSQLSAVKQKEALLEAARLDLSYTKVYAPSEGYVTRKSIEVGNQVQAEQPLMAVVALDDVWVVANYKETQLDKVRPGQKVEIEVDTYPGRTFTGRVESIMAGTGAVFSLFPPENATGNYVKVVQRVPVKILLDPRQDEEHVLRVGMSAVPTILVE
jgi:membrane fusion protein (multidrug efflux system)